MAGENSFDVVSQYDEQELVNALDQTRREVTTRFDLKDTRTEIKHEAKSITILTDSEFTLKSVRDVLESKLVRRSLSLKILKPGTIEQAGGNRVRQVFELQQGISADLARDISKQIRDHFPKARPQIQGDAVRVSAKSRDDLQAVIAYLKGKDFPVALQFINYRS
jgi:uncharacterized protein YajQ (UPF0234 family)